MATITDIAIGVVARTDRLNKGFNRATRTVLGFSRRVAGVVGRIALFGGALGTLAGGAGLGAVIVQQSRLVDQTVKTARKLGIGTKALVGFQVAADRAGVDARTFNTGLQRMVRRIGEASKGTGEARGALAELGLLNQRFVAMSPEDQFIAIAEAMNQVERQQDRVRLAFKLFDTEGVGFVNIFAQGADQIRRTITEAEQMGLTFRTGPASAVEAMLDRFQDLKSIVQGFFRQLTVALGPLLFIIFDSIVKKLQQIIESKGGLENFARFIVARVVEAALQLAEAFQNTLDVVRQIGDFLRSTSNIIEFAKRVSPIGGGLALKSLGLGAIGGRSVNEDPQLQDVIKLLGGVREDLQGLGLGFE